MKRAIQRTFPIIAVIFIITVVYSINQQEITETPSNTCYLSEKHCKFAIGDSQLSISFAQYPLEIEEPIDFFIHHDTHLVIEKSWLEGTNMYMGRTPIVFDTTSDAGRQKGALFIGACSEPKMRWRMTLVVRDLMSNSQHLVYLLFQTDV